MLRFVLTLLFVLSSGLASVAATEHGTGMAIGQLSHAAPAQHDHSGLMAHETPSCVDHGTCPAQAALCQWVCSGLLAIVTEPAGVMPAAASFVPGFPVAMTGDGITPDLSERPPQRSRL